MERPVQVQRAMSKHTNSASILAEKRVAALIPAAGSGVRMGRRTAKPFLQIDGREILARTLDVFEGAAMIDDIWVIVGAANIVACREGIIGRYGFKKVCGVVTGGASRQESVWRGLRRLDAGIDLVVVHDGVRPFVTEALLQETLACAAQHGAAVSAIPLSDTLKRVSSRGEVEATVPRDNLWRTQTPQAFRRQLLDAAHRQARQQGLCATDDAGLLESLGHPVRVVPGLEANIKITTPDDLDLSKRLLGMSTG